MPIITDIYTYEIQDPELYIKKSIVNLVQLLIQQRIELFLPKLREVANKKWPSMQVGTSPEQSPRTSSFYDTNNANDIAMGSATKTTGKNNLNDSVADKPNLNELVLLGILICAYSDGTRMIDKYGDFYPLETQGMNIYSLESPSYRIKTQQFNVDLDVSRFRIQALPGTPIAVKGFFSTDLKVFTVTDVAFPNEVVSISEQSITTSIPQGTELLALKSKLPKDLVAFKMFLTRQNIKSLIINQLQQPFGTKGQKSLEDVQQLAESGFTELGFDTVQQDIAISGILQATPQVILLPGPDDCTGEAYPQDQFLQVLYEKSLMSNAQFGQNPFVVTMFGKRAIIMDGLVAHHFADLELARGIVQSDHALVMAGVLFDYINTSEDFLYITANDIQVIIYLGAPDNKHYNVSLSDDRDIQVIFIQDIGLIDNQFNIYFGSLNIKNAD